MKQSYNIMNFELLNREIRNVHLVDQFDPAEVYLRNRILKQYRVIDVDITTDHEKIEKAIRDAKKSYKMDEKVKSPIFKSDGCWWIELRDYRDYDLAMLRNLEDKIYGQLGIENPDCKILQGDVSVRLINWEFNGRQGLSFKLNDFRFLRIKQDILENSPEPPKIEF